MRRLLLLLLVVLVIAAVADAHRKSKKRHSKKSGQGFIPSLKNFFGIGGKKHHTHKGSHHTHKGSHHTHKGSHHTHKGSHHTHKGSHHTHHTHHGGHHTHHTHTHTSSSHTQISIKYKIKVRHNYKQEVHCGKHCVPDIAFWKKDHCACKTGLVGAGDLCCTDPSEYKYTCTVRGGSYVHSYMKQSAQIFNPCGQVLAVINAKTSTHKSCHVTIRSADAIEGGLFITSQVETTLSIGGKVGTIILDGDRFYNSIEKKWVEFGNSYIQCFEVHGERIQLLLDRNRRVWTLSACGTLVNFRRDGRGGKPGVCISSKYEFSKRPCDHPKDIVCNRLDENTYPYDSKATYYLAKSFELKQYLKLKLTCPYHSLCKDVTNTFNTCCPARKAKAINKCSAILENDHKSCTTRRAGTNLFTKFVKCVKEYC